MITLGIIKCLDVNMWRVVQLVELQIVVLVVAGSSPVTSPSLKITLEVSCMSKIVKQLRSEEIRSSIICTLFAIAFAVATLVEFFGGVRVELMHISMTFAFSCAVMTFTFLAMWREFNS